MIIREEWSNNKGTGEMKSIWAKLKRMKSKFRQLNEAEFKGVTEKIEEARQTIQHIQKQLQNNYSDMLQEQESCRN